MSASSLTDPKLENISLLVRSADRDAVEAAIRARHPGWNITAPRYAPPGELSLEPTRDDVPPAEAFQLAGELRKLPGVVDAEPSFAVQYAVPAPTEAEPLPPGLETFGALNENDLEWSLQLVRAREAWAYSEELQRPSRGAGIVIAHPDSGYHEHPELPSNRLVKLEYDFIEGDGNVINKSGDHGLSTASVIASADNRNEKARSVTGIAPDAQLIGLRVSVPKLGLPSPVLFKDGAERLAEAIWYAADNGAHVISISLGWFGNGRLHRALRYAVGRNVIVVAAAGNYTGPIVVWPAAYPEAICMAACNFTKKPWSHSAWGKRVDASGPGENVWVASQPLDKYSFKSSGTSHAVATTAGIAALWLAHWGRDELVARYAEKGPTLQEVFRRVLTTTADPIADSTKYGVGIVDARACLEAKLPMPGFHETFGAEATVDPVAEAFPGLDPEDVAEHLAAALDVPQTDLPALLDLYGRELRFWSVVDPALREEIISPTDAAGSGVDVFGAATGSAFDPQKLPLSEGLRKAMDRARSGGE